jgi:hypothetical protein
VFEQDLAFYGVHAVVRLSLAVKMQDSQRKDSEVRLRIMKCSWLEQKIEMQEVSQMVGLYLAAKVLLPSTGGDYPDESNQEDFPHSLLNLRSALC